MEQTDNTITFAQFEEGDLPLETRNDTDISNKYYDDSNLAPLIKE